MWSKRQTWPPTCLWQFFISQRIGNWRRNVSELHTSRRTPLQRYGLRNWERPCTVGTLNVAAVRQLKWPWLNCFGHSLNLAVNYSLQKEKAKTDRAFGVCRSINGTFSHSRQRWWELCKAQEQLNIPQHMLLMVGLMYWLNNFLIAHTERKKGKIESTWTASCKVFIKTKNAPENSRGLLIRSIADLDEYE